jgi:hypothetical protein
MPLVLAPLGGVVAGLMALILLFAIGLLVDRIVQAVHDSWVPWPVDIGIIRTFQAIQTGINKAVDWLASVAQWGLTIVTAPARALITLVDSIVIGIARLGGWVRHLVYNQIPQLWYQIQNHFDMAIRFASDLAWRLYGDAINWTNTVRAYLERVISQGIANAIAYATSLYRIMEARLNAAILSLGSYALSLYNSAISALGRAVDNMVRDLLHVRSELIAYAQKLATWSVNTAIGISIDWARKYADQIIDWYNRSLASGVAGALAGPWNIALPAIDAIALALPESIAAALARIGAFPRVIPRDIAASVGAVAAVGAVAIDWVAECGVPLCRNARPFGDALAGLEDLALIAAIFELVVEGVANPNGAAHTIVTDIGAPMSTVLHEFGDMVGLGR